MLAHGTLFNQPPRGGVTCHEHDALYSAHPFNRQGVKLNDVAKLAQTRWGAKKASAVVDRRQKATVVAISVRVAKKETRQGGAAGSGGTFDSTTTRTAVALLNRFDRWYLP